MSPSPTPPFPGHRQRVEPGRHQHGVAWCGRRDRISKGAVRVVADPVEPVDGRVHLEGLVVLDRDRGQGRRGDPRGDDGGGHGQGDEARRRCGRSRRRCYRGVRSLKTWSLPYDGWVRPVTPRSLPCSRRFPRFHPAPTCGRRPGRRFDPPPPRRRFPAWVVGSAVITIVMCSARWSRRSSIRYDPSEHTRRVPVHRSRLRRRPRPMEPLRADPLRGEPRRGARRVAAGRPGRRAPHLGATGIAFVFDGLSDEVPERAPRRLPARSLRRSMGPGADRRGSTHGRAVRLRSAAADEAAGVAGPLYPASRAVDDLRERRGRDQRRRSRTRRGSASQGAQGPVVLHELAHVMGLGHYRAHGELMEPSGGGMTRASARATSRGWTSWAVPRAA